MAGSLQEVFETEPLQQVRQAAPHVFLSVHSVLNGGRGGHFIVLCSVNFPAGHGQTVEQPPAGQQVRQGEDTDGVREGRQGRSHRPSQ